MNEREHNIAVRVWGIRRYHPEMTDEAIMAQAVAEQDAWELTELKRLYPTTAIIFALATAVS